MNYINIYGYKLISWSFALQIGRVGEDRFVEKSEL